MNRGLYTGVTGMIADQKWMDMIANNLANVSTNGFKKDGLSFSDLLDQQVRTSGGLGKGLGTISAGTKIGATFTDYSVGPMQATGRPLDVAIQSPDAMFAVQTPQGIRYTRDGAFTLDQNRQLVNHDGFAVLDGSQQPITIPAGQVTIDTVGQISVNGKTAGTLGLFSGSFEKEGANLYASGDAATASGKTVQSGTIEGSNVNAVASMVDMITLQRTFDLTQKVVTQQDNLSQRLIQSLSGR
jgi:flagellar basal-body rod protein FlgF